MRKDMGVFEDKETAEKRIFLMRLSAKFIEPHGFYVWIYEDDFVQLLLEGRILHSWTTFDKCLFSKFSIFNLFVPNPDQFTYWAGLKSCVPCWIQTLAGVKSLEELKIKCATLGVFDDLFT